MHRSKVELWFLFYRTSPLKKNWQAMCRINFFSLSVASDGYSLFLI